MVLCLLLSTRLGLAISTDAKNAIAPCMWSTESRCGPLLTTWRPNTTGQPGRGARRCLTLAELAIAGRAAILIPLPTAADDHQSKNAARFAQPARPSWLNQQRVTGAQLAQLLGDLLADSGRRRAMSAAMRSLARPKAAAEIVDRLEKLTA